MSWVTIAVMLRLYLEGVGVDPTVCPYCKGTVAPAARTCPNCHVCLGKRAAH